MSTLLKTRISALLCGKLWKKHQPPNLRETWIHPKRYLLLPNPGSGQQLDMDENVPFIGSGTKVARILFFRSNLYHRQRLQVFPKKSISPSYTKILSYHQHCMETNFTGLLMNVLNLERGFYFSKAWDSIPSWQCCRDTTEAIFGPFHHSNSLPAHPYFIRPRL